MSNEANTAQRSAAPVEPKIKFKDMNVVQKLTYFGKAILCVFSFGFLFAHVFSDH